MLSPRNRQDKVYIEDWYFAFYLFSSCRDLLVAIESNSVLIGLSPGNRFVSSEADLQVEKTGTGFPLSI